MKISVLTPTIRPEGLKLVEKALRQQTFKDFEWLVGSPFFCPLSFPFIWVKDDFSGGFWTFNRIMNKMIKKAKGELLVSWQDYTYAKPDALEKFLRHYLANKKAIVGGVGNKYEDESWLKMVWKDPRERDDFGSFYETTFDNIEGNFCAVPKKAILEIGGFIEKMDFLGYGMDWYSVFERLEEAGGWKFYLDQTLKSYSLVHKKKKDWEKNNLLYHWEEIKEKFKKNGEWPFVSYLTKK